MDSTLFKSLLCRGESDTLDFKSDQYTLVGDESKGEFLKDLMAFVNVSRSTDAYILLGVKKRPGQPAEVCGISNDRDDNEFQTLARGKIVPPVQFTYESFDHDGKKCGVIQIPVQRKPAYVMNDFGKLREKAVYIRRGSSTGIATPEEIIQMGVAVSETKQPEFVILAHPRLIKEGVGYTLWLLTWLRNTGEGTANEVIVDVSANTQPGAKSGDWRAERSGNPWRYVSENLLHPSDEICLVSWKLMYIASNDVPVPPVAYKGGLISAKIVIRIKDKKPLTFELHYTKEQICSLEFKELKPAS